jgi:solute carrier family 34 (sodium-dependent phosphate cotransporter)
VTISNQKQCITGLLAALVTEGNGALQVALCHLNFNVFGIFLFYVIPFTRFPLFCAKALGRMTRYWRGFAFVYIAILFGIFPLLCLFLSSLLNRDEMGFVVLGIFILAVVVITVVGFIWNLKFNGGTERWLAWFAEREERRKAAASLPEDVSYLKEQFALLLEKSATHETKAPSHTEDGSDDLEKIEEE